MLVGYLCTTKLYVVFALGIVRNVSQKHRGEAAMRDRDDSEQSVMDEDDIEPDDVAAQDTAASVTATSSALREAGKRKRDEIASLL